MTSVTIWIDAQLPPQLAPWLSETFKVKAFSLRFLGLRDAEDEDIFTKAKLANVVLISKDSDFVELVQRFGSPPKLIWITVGNVTNANLRQLFTTTFQDILNLLEGDADIVELAVKKESER
jgi:predicted nuclease of predicted toxin-antitoxin system